MLTSRKTLTIVAALAASTMVVSYWVVSARGDGQRFGHDVASSQDPSGHGQGHLKQGLAWEPGPSSPRLTTGKREGESDHQYELRLRVIGRFEDFAERARLTREQRHKVLRILADVQEMALSASESEEKLLVLYAKYKGTPEIANELKERIDGLSWTDFREDIEMERDRRLAEVLTPDQMKEWRKLPIPVSPFAWIDVP